MQTITDAYRSARQKFVRWAVNWARSDSTEKQDPPDVTELVKMLDAIGYKLSHVDLSTPEDIKPIGDNEEHGGCRVVIICVKSGLRVVLEATGVQCKCPTVEAKDYQNDDLISPFSEPTALVVREVLKHLSQLDIQSDVSTDDASSLLGSPIFGSKRNNFGSADEPAPLRSNYQETGTLSNDDISTSCLCSGIRSTHSLSSEALTNGSGDSSSVDTKLKLAMENIRDALNCYYAETRKISTQSKNYDSLFKIPKSKTGTTKNSKAQQNDTYERIRLTPTKRDSTFTKDKLARPSTPHPFKKQTSRIQTPKSSATSTVTPEMTTRVKSRIGSIVKSAKK